MKKAQIFISALLAGMCVAFGGVVFLALDNKVLGAIFFTVGLFTICSFGLHLFTGKVCYFFDNGKEYRLLLPIIWIGNLIGSLIVGYGIRLTRMATICEKAVALCTTKLNDNLLSLFLLAVGCNIFIYIAVEGFNKIEAEIGRYIALFFGVTVFILSGFEHCIADMFYFTAAGMWSLKTVAVILVITAGNAIGGIGFHELKKLAKK